MKALFYLPFVLGVGVFAAAAANADDAGEDWNPVYDGIKYRVLVKGTGPSVLPGFFDRFGVSYTGTDPVTGRLLDRSSDGGAEFALGEVVEGWQRVVPKMRVGDEWEIAVPKLYADSKTKSDVLYKLRILHVKEGTLWDMFKYYGTYVVMVASVGLFCFGAAYVNDDGSVKNVKFLPLPEVGKAEAWFDVAVGEGKAARIEFQLFGDVCPRTVENFRQICAGTSGGLCYKNTMFHRIIPGFMCQGGDVDGKGGRSIYGRKFEDEFNNGGYRHSEPLLLSMANAGAHTNSSQFFITVAKTRWLDGKHVVFGRVVSGASVVKKMEAAGSASGRTSQPVRIVACGVH